MWVDNRILGNYGKACRVYLNDLEFYLVLSYENIAIVYRWVRLLEIRSKKFIEQWTGNILIIFRDWNNGDTLGLFL